MKDSCVTNFLKMQKFWLETSRMYMCVVAAEPGEGASRHRALRTGTIVHETNEGIIDVLKRGSWTVAMKVKRALHPFLYASGSKAVGIVSSIPGVWMFTVITKHTTSSGMYLRWMLIDSLSPSPAPLHKTAIHR